MPVQVLAMRDELAGRDFDLPGEWWPDQPGVVGGRDRRAGGTWCVSDVAAGTTAVVLNRPERRDALPGAASRGVLPLLALRHGDRWPDHVDIEPMAGFNVVLLQPDALTWWSFDGASLSREQLAAGTYQFKPRGRIAEVPAPLLTGGVTDVGAADIDADEYWGGWLRAVRDSEPTDDGAGLLVRRVVGDESYETVFGQLIASRPGTLRLDYRARVARADGPWSTRVWNAALGGSQGGGQGGRQPAPGEQKWVVS